jgi:tetratricopeptide (TPR) repeat protein
MNGDLYSEEFQYGPDSTIAPHSSEATELGALGLVPKKRFLYAFDEAEEYSLTIRVLGRTTMDGSEIDVEQIQGEPESVYAHLLEEDDEGDEGDTDDEGDEGDADDDGDAGVRGHQKATEYVEGGHEATEHIHGSGCDHPMHGVELAPELVEVGAELAERMVRWARLEVARQKREDESDELVVTLDESPADVDRDAALLERLFELSEGDEDRMEASLEAGLEEPLLWPFALSMPDRLSAVGKHDHAAQLCRRVDAVAPDIEAGVSLPVYLARAGRNDESLAEVEVLLREFPEDMYALRQAGEALVILGDLDRAETLLRQALHWAGGNLDVRAHAARLLLPILTASGREAEAKALVESETQRFEAMMEAMAEDEDEDE